MFLDIPLPSSAPGCSASLPCHIRTADVRFRTPTQSLSNAQALSFLVGGRGTDPPPRRPHGFYRNGRPPPPRRLMGAGAHWAVDFCSRFHSDDRRVTSYPV